jgi:hypothetical protein
MASSDDPPTDVITVVSKIEIEAIADELPPFLLDKPVEEQLKWQTENIIGKLELPNTPEYREWITEVSGEMFDLPLLRKFRSFSDGTSVETLYCSDLAKHVSITRASDGALAKLEFYANYLPHRNNAPAVIIYDDGKKIIERWYQRGQLDNGAEPAENAYNLDGSMYRQRWFSKGKITREDRGFNPDGSVRSRKWYTNGVLTRTDNF